MKRRTFVNKAVLTTASLGLANNVVGKIFTGAKPDIKIRALTKGPRFHWFGYYDKFQFDVSGRYALGMAVDFEGRSPLPSDEIEIGMVDLANDDKWIKLGTSSSWGWQQGCMLQWIPGSADEIIWNDCEDGKLISRILNIKTKKTRTLPKPVYALDPSGKWAIGTEFSRIQKLRPGYGYASVPDLYENVKAPKEIGLYKMNLLTGEHTMFAG